MMKKTKPLKFRHFALACFSLIALAMVIGIGLRTFMDSQDREWRKQHIVTTTADMLNSTVLVKCGRGQGSGTSFTRDGRTFVWTAGHCVMRDMEDVHVSWDSGNTSYKAKVLRYSDPNFGLDIALLEVDCPYQKRKTVSFQSSKVKVGLRIKHVGNIYGSRHFRSFTYGEISHNDRRYRFGRPHYQINCTATYGCSGGGVFNALTGEYIGMVTRRIRLDGVALVTPSTVIIEWAESSGVRWAVDSWFPMPKKIIPLIQPPTPPKGWEPTRANPCTAKKPC